MGSKAGRPLGRRAVFMLRPRKGSRPWPSGGRYPGFPKIPPPGIRAPLMWEKHGDDGPTLPVDIRFQEW